MRVPLAVLTAGVLLLAGCGGDDTSSAQSPTTTVSSAPTTEAPAEPSGAPGDCVAAETDGSGVVPELAGDPQDTGTEAMIGVGGENPPTELKTADVVEGEGTAATPADTVQVQYTGVFYCDGQTFDSSWARGEPAEFPLQGVVPGFAQGIEGMKPGGRREIVIPPDLGYGDQASGPVPPGSTLVFVVDLVGIS